MSDTERPEAAQVRTPLVRCPGCGVTASGTGATHRYIGASPGCWSQFGELLVSGITPPAHDTYAAQHRGVPGPQSLRSVAGHLMSLCRVVERGARPETAVASLRSVQRDFPWLEPPPLQGTRTVADVLAGRCDRRAYAESVWAAWAPHHPAVRTWLDETERDRGS
ncbi:DUF5946 family protein [Streptomyces sp. NPDC002952]|uniref:DUF5946 family protein n=1 Tax=Streptomyces sp. NPDC002952 TaxID=3364673 RepID=UPI0036B92DD9